MTDKPKQTHAITIAPDADLLERLDAWRQLQDVPPSRTATIEVAVKEFLDKRAQKLKREFPG